ncbi:hypothetical protein EYF80_035024 [Liparis tanakae]|uniref:Uncharacterized protein n=1 Tax=Liparis tanakae TaxID=230148 RepID=A0A4Z2GNA7_9TELE|nr:hypothetical protein EYF80_035024 [Liparis tanakae]
MATGHGDRSRTATGHGDRSATGHGDRSATGHGDRRGQATGDPCLSRENLKECPHCKTCDLTVSGDDMQGGDAQEGQPEQDWMATGHGDRDTTGLVDGRTAGLVEIQARRGWRLDFPESSSQDSFSSPSFLNACLRDSKLHSDALGTKHGGGSPPVFGGQRSRRWFLGRSATMVGVPKRFWARGRCRSFKTPYRTQPDVGVEGSALSSVTVELGAQHLRFGGQALTLHMGAEDIWNVAPGLLYRRRVHDFGLSSVVVELGWGRQHSWEDDSGFLTRWRCIFAPR